MGWAIAEHGSMVRDIDIIAVPWVEDAVGVWTLYEAIRNDLGPQEPGESTLGSFSKPCGRIALMVIQTGAVSYKGKNDMDDWNPPAIDISFIDPRSTKNDDGKTTKAEAILDAIRKTDVGSDIIIHNEDMSVAYILGMKCKEHPEKLDEDGGRVVK